MSFFKRGNPGGTCLPGPLQTLLPVADSARQFVSPAMFSHLAWHWYFEDFNIDAAQSDPLWGLYDVGSGDPTTAIKAGEAGGVYQIKLTSNSQEEQATFDLADNLVIRGNKPFFFAARCKIIGSMAANQKICIGLSSGRILDPDNYTRSIWHMLAGADQSLLLEADDTTTDSDDKDTGFDLTASTYYWHVIEQGFDLKTVFRLLDGDGQGIRSWNLKDHFGVTDVAMGANNLQPCITVYKASGTSQPDLYIDAIAFGGVRV